MSAAVDSARALDPERYRLGDRAPRTALRPASVPELCEIVRGAARDRRTLVPWGGGVSLPRMNAPDRYDLAIDLGALDQIVVDEPEDLTLTARCGVTIAALQSRLAARGQEFPIEAPLAARATLGGALAANASGPRRYRFGAPRDRILGARFVLADGTLVRTGGRVVKNVAGYGIHRLLCGSRGGLAILVEASLKLAPGPGTRVARVHRAPLAALADAARWRPLARLEPAFVTVLGGHAARTLEVPGLAPARAGEATLVIGLEDDPAWVRLQESQFADAFGAPAARLEGAEVAAIAQRLADLEATATTRSTFTTAGNTPATLAPLADLPFADHLVFHAPAGRLHVLEAPSSPSIEALAALGFTWIGGSFHDVAPAIAPMVATLELRARIRAALDPQRLMALGDAWESGAPGF